MAQPVKRLSHEHKDLSQDPGTLTESQHGGVQP